MEPIAKKTYYSIAEVSELTGLKAHVLRYWETQFAMISPTKNRGGTRVYQADEIEKILLVKHLLYEKRFTIEGAKRKLKEMRQDGTVKQEQKLNAVPAVLASIKEGLAAVRNVLTLPEGPAAPEGSAAPGGSAGSEPSAGSDASAGYEASAMPEPSGTPGASAAPEVPGLPGTPDNA